ncbi:DegV family protein with EDD domain [Natranaerovirga pectinivora]|uniref:DegV family protein with EDD domain n=1 Tax=Natranaerovirga pectinivora TaxID=682400 RepID=A0A4R3MIA9_9FIRM|nr:DegV family protein [Natranaerovirga pectinivora]TCT12109.1 DegV family protein with EDD domain [Natranaerovirga pectinivora]
MAIQIITDSNCDLPEEIIKKYNIEVLPILVYLDDVEYLDGVTIKPKKIFDDMKEGKVYKTSQIPPDMFSKVFDKYVKEGKECIYIAISSELSGTYQSAVMARNEILEEFPEADITNIDSQCVSLGFGLVVYKAALMAESGKSKDEIIEAVKQSAQNMEHVFTVDNLEYLCRGGRLSRTSAFVGGLLNIKPILSVENGKLVPLEKIRGRAKVIKRIVDLMKERGNNLSDQTIAISHGDDLETAHKLKNMIEEEFGCKDFIINNIGCAIGSHAGPGTLALFFSK